MYNGNAALRAAAATAVNVLLLLLVGCQKSTKHRTKAKQGRMIDFSSCVGEK